MFTTARLADRMPATNNVKIGPAVKNTSPICVAMPIGPDTGGAAVGSVTMAFTKEPRPPTIRPIQRTVCCAPTAMAVPRSLVAVEPSYAYSIPAMPRAPWLASICDGSRSVTCTSRVAPFVATIVIATACPAFARSTSTMSWPTKTWKRSPLMATMVSPGWMPAAAAGESGWTSSNCRPDVWRRKPHDGGEDGERQQDVHDDAGDQDEQADRQALRRERPRVARVVTVLPFELHEAADGQPVEGVEGLALRAQHLGARREADPELEDADTRQPSGEEVPELMDRPRACRGCRRRG